MTDKPKSLLREARNLIQGTSDMARGIFIGIGLRHDPLAPDAVALAVEWQERAARIAAVSDVDHRVISEEVKGFGLDQLDTIYRRICEGHEPHVVIAEVRERWKVER